MLFSIEEEIQNLSTNIKQLVMSNLPKPISNYVERFNNQYKFLKLDNANTSTIEELILNKKAQINNLLMSGLGASTLMLRLGAVINLSINLKKGLMRKMLY